MFQEHAASSTCANRAICHREREDADRARRREDKERRRLEKEERRLEKEERRIEREREEQEGGLTSVASRRIRHPVVE